MFQEERNQHHTVDPEEWNRSKGHETFPLEDCFSWKRMAAK